MFDSSHATDFIFDGDAPIPSRTQPIPDELVTFIKTHHRGLSRIVVKLHMARRRYAQLNGVRIGAAFDQSPEAEPETIARAIMAICADHHETTDRPCKFLIQAFVFKKATGDAVRKGIHIELGRDLDDGFGADYTEGIDDPDKLDSVLLDHIRRCHKEILAQAEVISEVGKEAIKNAGEVFKAKEDALQSRVAVSQALTDDKAGREHLARKDKRMDDVVTLLKDAVQMGVAQYAAKQAAAPTAAAPVTPVAPMPSLLAAVGAAPTPPRPENMKHQKFKALWSQLRDEQRSTIEAKFTKTQNEQVRRILECAEEEDGSAAIAKLVASLKRKPALLLELSGVLTQSQTAALLAIAAK